MNKENKNKAFFNSSDDKMTEKLVKLAEEKIVRESSEDQISKLFEYADKIGKLPVFFQDKSFLYSISENVHIENKLNTFH